MNREILFRGKQTERFNIHIMNPIYKDSVKDGFVYGSLIVHNERYYICITGHASNGFVVNNGVTTMVEVIPETVGQYTGLQDKNGTKIFEGDVLRLGDEVYKVIFRNCSFELRGKTTSVPISAWYGTDAFTDDGTLFEVIGNIHE